MVHLDNACDVALLLACLTFVFWQPGRIRPEKMRILYAEMSSSMWRPPAWVFGPIWGVLFLLQALAYYFYFSDYPGDRFYIEQFVFFVVGGAATKAWTPVFFEMRRYTSGTYLALFIWAITVASVTLFFIQGQNVSGGLLTPQIAWTLYATFLASSIAEARSNALGSE
jgi:translocator protein